MKQIEKKIIDHMLAFQPMNNWKQPWSGRAASSYVNYDQVEIVEQSTSG